MVKLKKILSMLNRDMENIEKIQKIHIKIPQLKIIMSEMKNPLDGIDGWLDVAAEIIDVFELLERETMEYEKAERLK